MKEKISITLDEGIIREIESLIDGIKIRNKSQAIEFLIRKSLAEKRVAVILAGGPEDKLKINNIYKPLVKLNKGTVIEAALEKLRKNKFIDVFIVGRKNILSEIFKKIGDGSRYGVSVQFVEETESPKKTLLDTARTLKLLKEKIKRPFLCLNCDIIFDYTLGRVWNFHIKSGCIATVLLKTSKTPGKYSVVELEGNKIIRFVEKPKKAESYLVYTGMFIAEPEIFSEPGNSLEYEVFPKLAKRGSLSGYVCSGTSEHIHKPKTPSLGRTSLFLAKDAGN